MTERETVKMLENIEREVNKARKPLIEHLYDGYLENEEIRKINDDLYDICTWLKCIRQEML